MNRPKVSHKHKKVCFTLMKTMDRDHDIRPGTLFRLNEKTWSMASCDGETDKDNIMTTRPTRGHLTPCSLEEGDLLLFVDVAYDPYTKVHLLRFLATDKIVGFRHRKGHTMKYLRRMMTKVNSGGEDV